MRIGIATVDITPPIGEVALAGFAARHGVNKGKYQDIEASVMAIENDGKKFVIVSAEILFFDRYFCDDVKHKIQEQTGLAPDQVWLGATHTHCGPQLIKSMPLFGPVNEAYYDEFCTKLIDAIERAMNDLEEARLYYTQSSCDIGINRRRPTEDGKVDWAPWQEGPVDRTVDILYSKTGDTVKAILYSFGCHPTTFGGFYVGGDYVGFARRFIQENTGAGAVMFIQGAGGEVKPNLTDEYNFKRGTMDDAIHFGQKVAESVYPKIAGNSGIEVEAPFSWKLESAKLPFDKSKQKSIEEIRGKIISDFDYSDIDKIGATEPTPYAQKKKQAEFISKKTESDWAEWMLLQMNGGIELPDYVELEVHVLNFRNFSMIGLAGEICATVGLKVRQALEGRNFWLAGYSNGVSGYIASSEDYELDGYEVSGFYQYYKYPGPFVSGIDQRIINKVKVLVSKCR